MSSLQESPPGRNHGNAIGWIVGSNLTKISEATGLSKFVLSRHKRNCYSEPPIQEKNLTPEQEIVIWLSRAEELWTLAALNADLRAQTAALAQGLKALEFSVRRRQEARDTKVATNAGCEPLTVAMLDEIVRRVEAAENSPPRVRALATLRVASDRILELAVRMHGDPELFRDVERCCTERIQPTAVN